MTLSNFIFSLELIIDTQCIILYFTEQFCNIMLQNNIKTEFYYQCRSFHGQIDNTWAWHVAQFHDTAGP